VDRPFQPCVWTSISTQSRACLLELGDRGATPIAADRGLFRRARMDEALLMPFCEW